MDLNVTLHCSEVLPVLQDFEYNTVSSLNYDGTIYVVADSDYTLAEIWDCETLEMEIEQQQNIVA